MARTARRRKSGFSTKTTFDWSPAKFVGIAFVLAFVIGFVCGAYAYG